MDVAWVSGNRHPTADGIGASLQSVEGRVESDKFGQEARGAAQALGQLVGKSRQVVERSIQQISGFNGIGPAALEGAPYAARLAQIFTHRLAVFVRRIV